MIGGGGDPSGFGLLRAGGIVLCGGRSSRMGRPKLALPFGGETMLGRVTRIVGAAVSPVVVVAAPDQEVPPLPPDVQIVRDRQEGLGPLAGLEAGLRALQPVADAAFATACDAPLLSVAFIRRLLSLLGEHDLVVPRDGTFHHPLAAVYRTRLADHMAGLVAAGRLRPLFLIQERRSLEVDVESLRDVDPRLDSLRNTNTPDAYRDALRDSGIEESRLLQLPGGG